jgi:hypothetical protein
MVIALIILIVLALVVLASIILSIAAGLPAIPRFRFPFPIETRNDFFDLVRNLNQSGDLWHPGRGDLPDPTAGDGTNGLPGSPMQ